MVNFKLSFRLCRPKTTHSFSPFNHKAREIAYPSPPPTTPNYSTQKKKNNNNNNKVSADESGWFSSSEGETDSFDSSNKKTRLMRESLTVVKWSEKPYEEFKKSMLEMILEKEMFEAKGLEQLLQCFLSLNSKHHHADIVAAFTEIWDLLNLPFLPLPSRT